MKQGLHLNFRQLKLEEVGTGWSHKHSREKFCVWFHLRKIKEKPVNNRSKQEVHIKSLRSGKRSWLAGSSLMMRHGTSLYMHDRWECVAVWFGSRVWPWRVSLRESIRRLNLSRVTLRFSSQSTSVDGEFKSMTSLLSLETLQRGTTSRSKGNGINCRLMEQRVDRQFG